MRNLNAAFLASTLAHLAAGLVLNQWPRSSFPPSVPLDGITVGIVFEVEEDGYDGDTSKESVGPLDVKTTAEHDPIKGAVSMAPIPPSPQETPFNPPHPEANPFGSGAPPSSESPMSHVNILAADSVDVDGTVLSQSKNKHPPPDALKYDSKTLHGLAVRKIDNDLPTRWTGTFVPLQNGVASAAIDLNRSGQAGLMRTESARPQDKVKARAERSSTSAPTLSRAKYIRTGNVPYPRAARVRGQQGTVLLSVKVEASGRPKEVQILKGSGTPSLDHTAVSSVREWEFEPARLNGIAIPSEIEVPIVFRLN